MLSFLQSYMTTVLMTYTARAHQFISHCTATNYLRSGLVDGSDPPSVNLVLALRPPERHKTSGSNVKLVVHRRLPIFPVALDSR